MDYLARLEQRAAMRAPATDPSKLQRYLRRVEGNTPPVEPLADMLNRNDRTRTLLESRVDRLTPEQQQGSLASIWVQAQREAAEAAAAQRLADARRASDMRTGATVAGLGALGAGAFYGRMQQEQEAQRLARELGTDMAVDNAVTEIPIDGPVLVPDVMPEGPTADVPDLFADDTYMPPVATADDLMMMDEVADAVDDITVPAPGMSLPLDAPADDEMDFYRRFQDTTTGKALEYTMPSPEEALGMSPGPESEVAMPDDLETLPGPQMRSIKALMRGGIPEGRARDIILRGSSMSPDEYRLVTGGRR
jgi:hypothetical protein